MIDALLRHSDPLLAPLVYLAARMLGRIRSLGVQHMPHSKGALLRAGTFPIRDHYYEPLFNPKGLRGPLNADRLLPGIDWNVAEQLELLEGFSFNHELAGIPEEQPEGIGFYMNNPAFRSGDAEYLYNLVRKVKPRRVFEIGSGHSTLMVIRAIEQNRRETPAYRCRHVCIEPYEKPWLEQTGATIVRTKAEEVDPALWHELDHDDLLFIDSSHIIRPQGDVVFEYLELLPSLKPGVLVHVHDVFSPRDYLRTWVVDEVKLYNEQYLLEAFLTHNRQWKIVGALNYLHHHHYDRLKAKCPYLTPDREPGSFYLRRVA